MFPSSPFTSRAAGTTGASFLRIPDGARYEAMGQAMAAAAEGAEAVFSNPAGLGRLGPASPSDLSLAYIQLLETAHVGSAAYAYPTALGVFGAGVITFSQSPQTAYSAQGDPSGSLNPYDMAVLFSYGTRIKPLLVGGNLKFIRSVSQDVSGTAFAADFGLQWLHLSEAGDGALDAGIAVSNLGTPIKVSALSDPLPFHIRTGIFWHTAPYLNSAFDLNMPIDDDPYVSLGLEGHVKLGMEKKWRAFLRAGYNQKYERSVDGFAGMTVGGGVDLERLKLDYAWIPAGSLGVSHRVSLAIRF